jgi:hypothetical protein
MHYQLTYSKPSFTLFVKAWLAEHLERFEGKLLNWIVDDLVRSFEKRRLIYKAKIDQIPSLSIPSAEYKLLLLTRLMKSYEKLDLSVSEVKIDEVQKSFKALKATFYSYEAMLRIHINKSSDIIPTPEYIKNEFSELGKRSLSKSIATKNAVC